jgi:hypothetical protein
MTSMPQRTLSGPILAEHLGGGLWQLTVGAAAAVRVYLRVPAGGRAAALEESPIQRIVLQWRDDGVTVRVTGGAGEGVLEASTAVIHEAQQGLYDALPLAAFDARARRFWRRVFLLMRIPGGRYLLHLIARRRR